MKKVKLCEVKLVDSTVHRGEIVYRDKEKIILKLPDGQKIRLLYTDIMSIKDLGWHKIKDWHNSTIIS